MTLQALNALTWPAVAFLVAAGAWILAAGWLVFVAVLRLVVYQARARHRGAAVEGLAAVRAHLGGSLADDAGPAAGLLSDAEEAAREAAARIRSAGARRPR